MVALHDELRDSVRALHHELFGANRSLIQLPRRSRKNQRAYVDVIEAMVAQCAATPDTRATLLKPARVWLSTPEVCAARLLAPFAPWSSTEELATLR